MNNYNAKKCICPTCPYVDKERKPSTKQYHPSNFYTSQSESETYYDAMDMIGMPCGDTNIPESKFKATSSLSTILRKISDPNQFRLALKNIVETAEGLLCALEETVRYGAEKCKNSITTIMAPKVPFAPASDSINDPPAETTSGSSCEAQHSCVKWNEEMKVCLDPISITVPLTLIIQPKVREETNPTFVWENTVEEEQTLTYEENISYNIISEPIRTSVVAAKSHHLHIYDSDTVTDFSYASDITAPDNSSCANQSDMSKCDADSVKTSSTDAYHQVMKDVAERENEIGTTLIPPQELPLPQQNDLGLCVSCKCQSCPVYDKDHKIVCPNNCGCYKCPRKGRAQVDLNNSKVKICPCGRRASASGLLSPNIVRRRQCMSDFDICPCSETAESRHIQLRNREMYPLIQENIQNQAQPKRET